ncbi:MAG: HNH endonuclease [Clostridiales bacterium]|nr:HNH endonuclease [Clostridiales bacterium]
MNRQFYHSKRWRRKAAAILRRDGYQCQISKRYGKRVEANTVHHIYPLEEYPEFALCDWNLISVSDSVHNQLHDRSTRKLTEMGVQLMRRTRGPTGNEL